MLLIFLPAALLKAEQFGLFDTPTLVAPHVRKDGTLVNAHMRVVKKRAAQPIKARVVARHKPHTLDLFAGHDQPIIVGQSGDLFAQPAKAPVTASIQVEKPEAPAPDHIPDATKIVEPGADVKWFGSREKADAWIGKKGLAATHEVVQVDRRFEIHEKASIEQGPQEGERNADGLVFRDGRWHRDDEEVVGTDAPKGPMPIPEKAFAELLQDFEQGEDGIPTFFEPDETVRTEARAKAAGDISQAEADKRIAEWKAHAKAQGEAHVNQGKVVLSLFDTSGEWSQPWVDAGYEVHRFDIQDGIDINEFSVEYLTEVLGIERCDVLLAAPPCTDFSISGAHAWKRKDADGRTQASVQLVEQTLRTIEFFKPAVWAMENPVGRIKKLAGLPKPALSFQPANFGNPYTKRTYLWGDMQTELPLASVHPADGSKMTTKYSGRDKYQRSLTPDGFAYSFFMANNLADMGVAGGLAQEFKGIPRDEFKAAVDAGMSEIDIRSTIEDAYYDQDLDAARAALRDAMPTPPTPTGEPVVNQEITTDQAAPTQLGLDYDRPFDPAAIPAFGVSAGVTKGERIRLNGEAVALVNRGGPFTDAERTTLSQYSGNGGVGDSLNEFYTDTRVAAAMWQVLHNLGLPEGSEVLEPSAATGVFMHTAPAGVKVVGVELDGISSRIARALHGAAHEVNNASLERFATQDDRQFDAVIGNPPFGLRGGLIKDDKPHLSTAEQYFIDTSLDKTKPGGIVALVLPSGVMDSKTGRAFREAVLLKGEFLGAQRMPNTAFEHAHTGVTTDVLYLRKRPDDVAGALDSADMDTLRSLGVWQDEFIAGGYFTGTGAGNVLGTMTEGWRAKAGMGQDITVEGSMRGVPEAIAAFKPAATGTAPSMEQVLAALPSDEARKRALSAAAKRPYAAAKLGDTKIVDGIHYVLQGNPPRWHKIEQLMEREPVADAVPLANEIERLMTGKAADRQALEAAVKAYVDKHGIPAKNDDLMTAAGQNKTLYRLIGAVKPDGTLSDVVTGTARKQEGTLDSAAQALATEHGTFTAADLAERWGKGDADEVLDHLYASKTYALNADGSWTTMDAYLTGDLWPKLDEARGALAGKQISAIDRDKMERQAKQLEEVIDPASLDDVDIAVNQGWIPLDVVGEFFTARNKNGGTWTRDLPPVHIDYADGIYTVTGGNEYGEVKLLSTYLNRTGVKKDDKATLDAMNRDFKEWVLTSSHRDDLEDRYNRKFRGFAERSYSEEPFEVPGLNADGLKAYQYAGLRWAMDAGKGIIAADVGLGKTARGLILAKLAKAEGKAQRPMIVVPKSVLANWYAEAERWFPGSRVLTIGESYARDEDGKLIGRQDTPAERKRKYHDLTQNDYDFILISQPAFEEVDVSPALKNSYLGDDFWVQRGEKLGNAGDKRVKKVREAYEQSVAKREFSDRTDAIHFEDLGVDMLLLDEGHAYKNLYAARNRFGESPKFLGGQGQSNRAFDMSFKTRYVRDNNDGKNVFTLTATPTKNSPLEIYSMLSYVAPEAFEKIGIRNSEDFLDRFCVFSNENILSTTGEIEDALVTSGFKNMDELREIMRRYIHRTTAADVGLKLPERNDHMHAVDMDEQQQAAYVELRALAEESAKKDDATGDAHIFSIMDKMSKASMDLELLDPKAYAGHVSPKYLEAAKQITNGAQDGGQVVFADFVAAHEKIAQELVKSGIPRNQIAIINAQVAGSSLKRQRIADDFNAGKLKVVIGNTATMGEGINLQVGTTDIHHLDLPWEPASVQQRNGRGLRQGNTSEAVRIHTYLSKGSFDGYKYQTVAAKRDWQDDLWNGGNTIANGNRPDNLAREDMLIMLAADPDEARKQFKENKAAALERHGSEKRRDVAVQFTRLQGLKRTYAGLKAKGSRSAIKLAAEIEKAKNNLYDSKFFTAKDLLNSDAPAVIHPDTGSGITLGTVLHLGERSKISGGGQWVVTGVNPADGRLKLRQYAGTRGMNVELPDLGSDVTTSKLDEKVESAEMARKAAETITAGDSPINSPRQVADLPADTVRQLYPKIQQQLKESAKSYKMDRDFNNGRIGLIDKAGQPKAIEYYSADKLHDSHDYLLATDEHREKVLQAYVDAERGKKFSTDWQQSGGRRGSNRGEYVFRQKYEGGWDWYTNPWGEVGKKLFGAEFEQEAMQRVASQIAPAGRRTASAAEAYQMLKPMAQVAQYGADRVTMPKRALATIYAKAKRDKVLDTATRYALKADKKEDHQILNIDSPLIGSLIERANKSGHQDLAASMVLDHYKANPRKALEMLSTVTSQHSDSRYQGTSSVISKEGKQAIRYLVGKHPELGELTFDQLPYGMRNIWPGRPVNLGEALQESK